MFLLFATIIVFLFFWDVLLPAQLRLLQLFQSLIRLTLILFFPAKRITRNQLVYLQPDELFGKLLIH
jgi:hypothetical protein